MGLQFILVLCLAAVFCFAPLAVYLYWLSKITRRLRPTVISGAWDFVGLLAGLSGFILFGGGLVVSLLQSNFRYWMRGNFNALRNQPDSDQIVWVLVAGGYLLLVFGLVALGLASRRRSLVIYNVEPAAFETILAEVCEHLNRPVERRGNVWASGEPLFELDRFPRGRTVTLRWLSSNLALFQDVDRLVREAVRPLAPEENPFSQWFMAAAFGSGLSALACFLLLVYALRLL